MHEGFSPGRRARFTGEDTRIFGSHTEFPESGFTDPGNDDAGLSVFIGFGTAAALSLLYTSC